jgi:predicted esterase
VAGVPRTGEKLVRLRIPAREAAVEPSQHHIQVRRSARYFRLGPAPEATREIWFVLHGYGQLAERFMGRFGPLAAAGRLVVAPEALSRYYLVEEGPHGPDSPVGASWMTREDRELEISDYLAYLDRLRFLLVDEPYRLGTTVQLLGFSQGCATAARWAVHGYARPGRLVLWGALLPPDLDLERARERFARCPLTFVLGRADDSVDPERVRSEEARLRDAGIPYEIQWYDGGHGIDDAVLRRIAL